MVCLCRPAIVGVVFQSMIRPVSSRQEVFFSVGLVWQVCPFNIDLPGAWCVASTHIYARGKWRLCEHWCTVRQGWWRGQTSSWMFHSWLPFGLLHGHHLFSYVVISLELKMAWSWKWLLDMISSSSAMVCKPTSVEPMWKPMPDDWSASMAPFWKSL